MYRDRRTARPARGHFSAFFVLHCSSRDLRTWLRPHGAGTSGEGQLARGGLGVAPAPGGQRFSPCAPVLVRGSRPTPCPFPPLAKASPPPLFLPRAPRAGTPRSRRGPVHLPSVNMAGRAGGGAACHPASAGCRRGSSAAIRPRISTRVVTPQVRRTGAGGHGVLRYKEAQGNRSRADWGRDEKRVGTSRSPAWKSGKILSAGREVVVPPPPPTLRKAEGQEIKRVKVMEE